MPYPQEAKKLRENMKIDGPVVLYIGRIAFYKGVDDIIAAYYIAKKEIPDLNLVIGGTPDFQMAKKYEEWKIKYTDIHFVGYVEDQKLPYYYSMGDVFVTYSFASEGFGLTPIEAIACGTPLLVETDHEALEMEFPFYDALYAFLQQQIIIKKNQRENYYGE